jgi:hypothetical protein
MDIYHPELSSAFRNSTLCAVPIDCVYQCQKEQWFILATRLVIQGADHGWNIKVKLLMESGFCLNMDASLNCSSMFLGTLLDKTELKTV